MGRWVGFLQVTGLRFLSLHFRPIELRSVLFLRSTFGVLHENQIVTISAFALDYALQEISVLVVRSLRTMDWTGHTTPPIFLRAARDLYYIFLTYYIRLVS